MDALKLPISDLKEFGVMDENNSFSKRLSEEDINNFLHGATIVCDNETRRITFRLCENNTRLEVNMYETDKNISHIRNESKLEIAYANLEEISRLDVLNHEKKAYILDKETKNVMEYDFIKNSTELTKLIIEKKDETEIKRYKQELLKFKELLQEKMDKYPLIAKYIARDLDVISNTLTSINNINTTKTRKENTKISLNDPDVYGKKHDNKEDIEVEKEERRRTFRR